MGYWPICLAEVSEKTEIGAQNSIDVPQGFVVCTGWHALCTVTDCRLNGDKANCDCFRVNETHIVETTAIQDNWIKRLTQTKCTNGHPCNIDEAPACKAIKYGDYKVDNVKYE
jgi:hypothetical protein